MNGLKPACINRLEKRRTLFTVFYRKPTIDFLLFVYFSGKPHGILTARKLKIRRRDQRWHDKDYKKAHLGTRWKANPFGGASHAKGIVLEKV